MESVIGKKQQQVENAFWGKREMTETELKPCPFCGGLAFIYSEDGEYYRVVCDNCDGAIERNSDNKKEAVKAWNTRPIENKMKRDVVKLKMTNKLLKRKVKRLQEALGVILDSAQKDEPCIQAIRAVAYTALKEKE